MRRTLFILPSGIVSLGCEQPKDQPVKPLELPKTPAPAPAPEPKSATVTEADLAPVDAFIRWADNVFAEWPKAKALVPEPDCYSGDEPDAGWCSGLAQGTPGYGLKWHSQIPDAVFVESEGPSYKAKSAPRCDYFGESVREVRNWLWAGAHLRYCDAGAKTYWLKKTESGNLYTSVRTKQAAETEGFWEKIANQGVTLPPPP